MSLNPSNRDESINVIEESFTKVSAPQFIIILIDTLLNKVKPPNHLSLVIAYKEKTQWYCKRIDPIDNLTAEQNSESVCKMVANKMSESMDIESCEVPTEGNEKRNRLSLLGYISEAITHFIRKRLPGETFCDTHEQHQATRAENSKAAVITYLHKYLMSCRKNDEVMSSSSQDLSPALKASELGLKLSNVIYQEEPSKENENEETLKE